jgi:hypothetical protein
MRHEVIMPKVSRIPVLDPTSDSPEWWEEAFDSVGNKVSLLMLHADAQAHLHAQDEEHVESDAWCQIETMLAEIHGDVAKLRHSMELLRAERSPKRGGAR